MINESFCSYYLESRNIAIVNEVASTSTPQRLQLAISISQVTSGLNPVRLARYPQLMDIIQTALQRTGTVQNIEATYMKDLVKFFQETRSISDYVEELLRTNKKDSIMLAQRILAQLQEIEECVICYTNSSSTFFQCGHRVCSTCSTSLETCPFCRRAIKAYLQKLDEAEKEKKTDSSEPKKLPRFQLVEGDIMKFIETRFSGLVKRSSTVDNKTATEISKLIEFYPHEILKIAKELLPSISAEEITCYLSAKLFFKIVLDSNLSHSKWNSSQLETADFLAKKITSPSRLIRFLSSISKDEPVKDEVVKIKLSNPFRKWIITAINKFEIGRAETEMRQRKGFWVWLFKKLHIRDSKWKVYTVAQDLGNFVRGNRKAITKPPMSEFNKLYMRPDSKLLEFFLKNPGLCFRFFRCSLLKLQKKLKKEEWQEFLSKIIPKMKPSQLIELLHILQMASSLEGDIVYRIKNGQFYWPNASFTSKIDKTLLETTITAVQSAIKPFPYRLIVDTTYPLHYLRLAKGRPPKVPDWVPQVSAAGDIIKVDPNSQVVIFVHWMNGSTRVDLDLSVMCVGKSKMLGKVDYTRLQGFNNTIQHSGDFTNAPPPNGCSEYITFVPASVVKASPNIEELFVLCFSFNAVPFDQMGQAFVGIGVLDKAQKGLGPNGCTVIAGCELRGSCQVNFTSKYNFQKHEFTFFNTNVTSQKGAYSIGTASMQISTVASKFTTWLKSRSPASFSEVVKSLYLGAKEVQLVSGRSSKLFVKGEKENGISFSERIQSGKDDKPNENSNPKVAYFGSVEKLTDEVTSKWPANSLVIAKQDPQTGSNVVWSTDPYSIYS